MAKTKRTFNFSKYKQRHIALKILYFGWDYDGLAEQQNNVNTVEHHLFQALGTTCLIASRDKSHYNRCGRTDKGVSSFGQVVSLNVRSNLTDESAPQNVGLFSPPEYTGQAESDTQDQKEELNYVEILNRVLPKHIKAIAWAPVGVQFSSRFGCKSRSYSYVFPCGNLCLDSINKAAQYLVGEHDFRNLCSFDLKNGVVNHRRTILSAEVRPLPAIDKTQMHGVDGEQNPYQFYETVIVGQAFLYHQIRCIMTILFLVGTKKEPPEVVKDLLDINRCPARPHYNRASPLPLCLFGCEYLPSDLPLGWVYEQRTLKNLHRQLKNLWLHYKTKCALIERAIMQVGALTLDGDNSLAETRLDSKRVKLDSTFEWKDFGLEYDSMSDTKYIPLMSRSCDDTLEKKLESMQNKAIS